MEELRVVVAQQKRVIEVLSKQVGKLLDDVARLTKKPAKGKAKKAEAASAAPAQEKKAAPRQVSDKFSVKTLLQAKKLSESLGGVEAAREALAALSKLLG